MGKCCSRRTALALGCRMLSLGINATCVQTASPSDSVLRWMLAPFGSQSLQSYALGYGFDTYPKEGKLRKHNNHRLVTRRKVVRHINIPKLYVVHALNTQHIFQDNYCQDRWPVTARKSCKYFAISISLIVRIQKCM